MIYVVQAGDTVDKIAAQFQVPVRELAYQNQISYPYRLAVGQALFIEKGQEGPKSPLLTFGYGYPFMEQEVLADTLPFLSRLNIFSYGFTEDGTLVPPAIDETWMIQAAKESGVIPMLTLTSIGPDGRFHNDLVSVLAKDFAMQQRLIRQMWQVMEKKGYGGVDLDFEYIEEADRDAYTAFVKRVTIMMNVFGFVVTVALAPKYSADQKGILYQGMDYAGLGAAANEVFLMTYEWGYTYGPPMAVSPIHQVRRVVEYAITEIPREKINLGIPNYGYDWPLPYEQGVTKARTLGNMEAVNLAIDFGVEIQFDETAQAPYFRYWQYGIQHEVWFQDVRSMQAAFDLIKEYGLHGAGYWNLMKLFRANWLLLSRNFSIIR